MKRACTRRAFLKTSMWAAAGVGVTGVGGPVRRSAAEAEANYPDPANNPQSPLMLAGDWVPADTHAIDFDNLPAVPTEHIVVSDVREDNGVNQHNYLIYHDGRFWAMWSDGPDIEDRVGQVVKFATSEDGVTWSKPEFITPSPPDSGPDSPHYNTRSEEGFRWISRGFWAREGELLALVSLDEAAGFFGPSLELRAFRWDEAAGSWRDAGQVYDNAINNFPPKRLPTEEWMMSRRSHDYHRRGTMFLIGGLEALDSWASFPVPAGPLDAEEPLWWNLPGGNQMALYRDNRQSGYIFRSFSTDNGRTWSQPVRTNFPDARSKIFGMQLSDGRYAMVSNPHPERRDPLALALSNDGLVFNKLLYLVGGRHVDYPHMIEHDGHLYIAHSGGKRSVEIQKVRLADLDDIQMPASGS
ncbi:MAG: exo-alpha-sialidase [Candidatus Hydrogenedentota bacterium]